MKTLRSLIYANTITWANKNTTTWPTSIRIRPGDFPSRLFRCLALAVCFQSQRPMKRWDHRNQFHIRLSMRLGTTRSRVPAIFCHRLPHHDDLSTMALFELEVAPACRQHRTTMSAHHRTHSKALGSRGGLLGKRQHRPQTTRAQCHRFRIVLRHTAPA